MKGWKVVLLGLTALGAAGAGQGKVMVLDTSPNMEKPLTPDIFATLTRRADNFHGNYVQSAYLERPYGILSLSAATNANYEPAAARRGMKSFRELSGSDTNEKLTGGGASYSQGSTVSRDDAATGITDGFVSLLTICGLAVYQLCRKQQLLKHLPLSR